ncbi:transglycosylase domain-containing protein [Humibacter sp.]|uniref:transglycosylase domain-containing protein n=1 Tax=Humibacter sp. TaxID=1940291 RepID=UPI002C98B750|nr:transglycosylase domain-containing protein [Humibacter sp.]HVX09465.1 transglycosylase domain-containing protein [Humibacter sp.]
MKTTGTFWGALAAFVGMSAVAGVLVVAAVTPAAAVTSLAVSDATNTFDGLPDYLALQPLDQTTTFYASKGGQKVPIATFYAQNRQDVSSAQIAQTVKDAAVDTEDPRFYSEGGIDVYGTIRGAIATSTGGDVQGGSSITQQYVKNILVQRCDENDQVDPSASAAEQKKQRAKFEQCYEDAAGVTVSRKLQEIRYAIGLDKRYSKTDILRSYLNIVGFGGQIYGVQAAAKYYFGVDAKHLSLPQSATLVAILNNPNYLRIDDGSIKPDDSATDNNSKNGFAATKARRDYVLQRMLVHKSITKAQYKQAVATPITPKITPTPSGCQSAVAYDAGFFCDYVKHVMLQDPAFGKTADERQLRFQRGGMNVYTTLNLDLQNTAQHALSAYVPSSDAQVDVGGANVSVEVGTGRIVTMVENKSFDDTGSGGAGSTAINYNTDNAYGGSNGFQTGSSFKAFDLAAWFEAGHTAYESVNAHYSGYPFPFSDFTASCQGGRLSGGSYPVSNDSSSEGGTMSVLQATEESVNTAFMQMATQTDLCSIANVAKALGVHSASPTTNPFQIVPSMVIGTNYIAPLTMATAYAGIANNGKFCSNVAIDKIVTTSGASVAVPKSTCTQAIPSTVAAALAWTLEHVLTAGTATSANPHDGTPTLAKTGTTDSYQQNWLVTSSSKVANAIWVGQISGSHDLRDYDYNGTELAYAKFYADRQILAALDANYGGSEFTSPPNSLLYGSSKGSSTQSGAGNSSDNGNGGAGNGGANGGGGPSTPGNGNGAPTNGGGGTGASDGGQGSGSGGPGAGTGQGTGTGQGGGTNPPSTGG